MGLHKFRYALVAAEPVITLLFLLPFSGTASFAQTPQPVPSHQVNQQSKTKEQNQNSASNSQLQPPTTVAQPPTSVRFICTPETKTEQNTPNHDPEKPEVKIDYPAWALVVVTTLGVLYAALTLKQIRKEAAHTGNIAKAANDNAEATLAIAEAAKSSAEATKFSAEAADANAKSIKLSERAWIQAGPDMPDFKVSSLDGKIAVFNWIIKNDGRTPARIREIAARYRLIKSLSRIPEIPEYDGDLEKIPLYNMLLRPGDQFSSVQHLEPSTILMPDDLVAVQRGEKVLFAYGYVTYVDVFGDEHNTAFCYHYLVPQGELVSYLKEAWRPYLQAPAAYQTTT